MIRRSFPQSQRIILRASLLIAVVSVVAVMMSQAVGAQNVELKQQITPPDCTQPGSCQMDPPVIDSVDMNGGRPIFGGRYDAAFTKYLRVTFRGETYVLGIDGELTVNGDRWRLDLSALQPPLPEGSYVLTVEAEGFDGTIRRDTITVRMTGGETPPDGNGTQQPPRRSGNGGWLPNTGESVVLIIGAAVALLILAVVVARRRTIAQRAKNRYNSK